MAAGVCHKRIYVRSPLIVGWSEMYINKVRQWQLFLQTCLLYTHIHPQGVEQLLSGLKLHKASGPYMIPTYVPFETACSPAGSCPDSALSGLPWSRTTASRLEIVITNVLPIFKKSNQSLLSNYQPISLTSMLQGHGTHYVFQHPTCTIFKDIYFM